ncbi:MAG: potassium/proton antiporter [Thermoleophilaceae bacterium]
MADGNLILIGGALLAAGLAASLAAARLRVPGLVLFLGLGMAVGSDGAGWIEFNDYRLARTIGVIALALILFEGGLASGFREIRPVLGPGIALATLGTALTAAVAGLAAGWLFDLSTVEGLLLGSIVAATDGAAIFALLRGSTLRRKLARTLEAESGLNDPVAVLLVLAFIQFVTEPSYGIGDMAWLFARQIAIGALAGGLVGAVAVAGFRRAPLATSGLYPVASLATLALAYGGADSLHGSGFLAVYIAGLALGSATIPARQTITAFHDGLAWVAQLTMFLALGLLVSPSQLPDVWLEGTVLALVVVLVARPLATLVTLGTARYSLAERGLLGWAGLRGAVPVVLATFPVIENVPHSIEFFNIVFFAVVLSTLLQGGTFEPLARRLGLTTEEPALPRPLTEAGTIRRLGAEVLEYPVAPGDAIVGARVRDLGLPRDAVVNVIVREGQAIPPRGSTRLREHDRLHVLLRHEAAARTRELTELWRSGPIGPPPRPPRVPLGRAAIFSSAPWRERDGNPARPVRVRGVLVVDQLRIRRDQPGGLFALEDGRYAATGAVLALGSRGDLTAWARRRMASAGADERAWLQTVIGALALDLHE